MNMINKQASTGTSRPNKESEPFHLKLEIIEPSPVASGHQGSSCDSVYHSTAPMSDAAGNRIINSIP